MKINIKGETIPEVLMVMLVLGSVMSAAFVMTGRVTGNNRGALERSEASAYGQQQIERLKTLLNRDVALTGNFCINTINVVVPVGDPSVGGCVDSINNRYRSTISYDMPTKTYTTTVRWEDVSGKGIDNLKLIYRVEYLTDATGGTPPAPVAPTTDPCPDSGIPSGQLRACYYNDNTFGRYAVQTLKPVISTAPLFTNALDDNNGQRSPHPSVDTDNFSARYEGFFNFNIGTYLFNAGGDDGIRLFIDDNPIPLIDQFRQQSYTNYSASHTFLTAGLHKLRLDYYENAVDSRATLSWGVEQQTLVEAESFTPINPGISAQPDASASAGQMMAMLSAGSATKTNQIIAHPFKSVIVRARGDSYKGAPPLTLVIKQTTMVPVSTYTKNVGSKTYHEYVFNGIDFPAGTYDFRYNFGLDECGDPVEGVACGPLYDRNLYVDKLTFNESDRSPSVDPPSPADNPAPTCDQLTPLGSFQACYYNGMNRETFIFGRKETTINNVWPNGTSPGPGVGANKFSARYIGRFNLSAGNYKFTTTSDDGVRLLVNGTTIIDQYNDHPPTDHTGTITLTGTAPHTIEMLYYENTVDATAKLKWVRD